MSHCQCVIYFYIWLIKKNIFDHENSFKQKSRLKKNACLFGIDSPVFNLSTKTVEKKTIQRIFSKVSPRTRKYFFAICHIFFPKVIFQQQKHTHKYLQNLIQLSIPTQQLINNDSSLITFCCRCRYVYIGPILYYTIVYQV